MARTTQLLLASVAAVALTACADLTNSSDLNTLALQSAFQTIPVGFSSNSQSFDAAGDEGLPFFPGRMDGMGGRGGPGGPGGPPPGGPMGRGGPEDHHDGFGPGIRGFLMGGGLGPDFLGVYGFGKGRGRGPFGVYNLPSTCTFSATTGVVSCPDKTDRGLTVSASFTFKNEAGTAQSAFDTLTTNSVNVQIAVSGTRTRRDSSTSTVEHHSSRTVGGLAPGKTERTVDGAATASEVTNGTRDGVAFEATRETADTTRGVVIPIADGRPTVPSAGTVIRVMNVSITADGATSSRSRREEITFDGTNVIKVKITVDGETKNCTITAPAKRLNCGE